MGRKSNRCEKPHLLSKMHLSTWSRQNTHGSVLFIWELLGLGSLRKRLWLKSCACKVPAVRRLAYTSCISSLAQSFSKKQPQAFLSLGNTHGLFVLQQNASWLFPFRLKTKGSREGTIDIYAHRTLIYAQTWFQLWVWQYILVTLGKSI